MVEIRDIDTSPHASQLTTPAHNYFQKLGEALSPNKLEALQQFALLSSIYLYKKYPMSTFFVSRQPTRNVNIISSKVSQRLPLCLLTKESKKLKKNLCFCFYLQQQLVFDSFTKQRQLVFTCVIGRADGRHRIEPVSTYHSDEHRSTVPRNV